MIYKFTVLSDEVDDFVREMNIDPEATFKELHDCILESVKYDKNQMTSFFICSDDWEKGQEVTLIEMESSSEYDNLVMEDIKLEELISDEKQKMLFVFDMISDRSFFMELTEIIPGKSVEKPTCITSKGSAPVQIMADEAVSVAPRINLDENFYGDESFDLDELDEEGFGDLSFDDTTLFDDDTK
ncbi:MAG: hypothetical protein AUK44_04240 [Porphyromonadaceae bacterium CG2_30_38_12]|nr:MAG: hypothetical protein AUK44_04240 [Porphyromonadaceae bacterium CG2_30_38_12]